MTSVSFFVPGLPKAQGSLRAFTNPNGGPPIVTSTTKGLKPWRESIANRAAEHCAAVFEGPCVVILSFRLPKPKSAPKYLIWPAVRPDIDKLLRASLDAMTGVVFRDDRLVVDVTCRKIYAEQVRRPERERLSARPRVYGIA